MLSNEFYCLVLAESVEGVADIIIRYLYRLGYHLRVGSRSFYNTETTISSATDDNDCLVYDGISRLMFKLRDFINLSFRESYQNVVFEIISLTGNKCGDIYISPGQDRNYMITINIKQDFLFHSVSSYVGIKPSDNIILFSLSINDRAQTKASFVKSVESFTGASLPEFISSFGYSMKFIEHYQKNVVQWIGMTVKADGIDFSNYGSSRLSCNTKGLCSLVMSPMDRYKVDLDTPIVKSPRQYPILHIGS